jgi:TctA family transporter
LFIIARSLFLGLLASLCVAPLALLLLPPLYAFAKPLSAFVLAAIVGLAVASEKSVARGVAALGVFLLSGAVGFAALALPLAAAPLFPLLAGLFGVPALLFSFGAKPAKFSCEAASERAGEGLRLAAVDWRLVLSGVGVGALSVLFPALSPALLCGAIFLFLESDAESFLEASSALVASKMLFDFAGVFAIGKARSGAAAFVLESFASRGASASLADYALVCLAALAALGLGLAALVVLRRRFAALFERAAGSAFSAALLVLIAIGSLVFSGFGGVLVLAAAAAAGCVAPLLGLKRSFAMGALFVPSILFSLGAAAGVTQLFY